MNNKIINKLKEETNNSSYIIYREKYIKKIKIDIIYNEALTDQDKMSNYIYRSLDYIDSIYKGKDSLYDVIKNNISNIKIKEIKNYEDICKYLNNGFVILLIEDDYSLQISDKDLDGAEEFVEKYLEWAKPRLLKYQQIPKNEVINKIYEMLGKVKD